MNHPGLDVLLAHVDGELAHDEASAVAGHLELCASCRDAVAGIDATTDVFAGVLAGLDANEPASWAAGPEAVPTGAVPGIDTRGARGGADVLGARGGADVLRARGGAPVLPLRLRGSAPASASGRGGLRWAAGILLVTGAAASAAILSDRLVSDPTAAVPAASDAADAAAAENVAMVIVEPLNGRVRVSLTGAGAGSTVHVVLAAGQAASVAVEGAESPHFTAVAGHVQLDLRAATAAVRLSLPYGLRAATVTLDGMTIIRVDADVVTPAEVLDSGLKLDAAAEVRPE